MIIVKAKRVTVSPSPRFRDFDANAIVSYAKKHFSMRNGVPSNHFSKTLVAVYKSIFYSKSVHDMFYVTVSQNNKEWSKAVIFLFQGRVPVESEVGLYAFGRKRKGYILEPIN